VGKILIGTSGWHYSHWREIFYPKGLRPDQYLGYYAERFPTVEVNNTFYRLPTEQTVKSWNAGTPENFCFALKAGRYITHRKRLKDPELTLRRFLALLPLMGPKLGPVLFQLPPRFKADPARLGSFMEALPKPLRYAFEFRDQSWFVDEVRVLLEAREAAFCLYDQAGLVTPEWVTARFVYLRLHGASALHHGRYTDQMLRAYADKIGSWADEGRDVFCYFNNDSQGNAISNARTLGQMLSQR